MKTHISIALVCVFLAACAGSNNTPNVNHAHHNMNMNASANTATMDHNSMGHGDASDQANMQSSPGAATAPYDLQFLDTMTSHHQGAVDMAKLAETRAEHKELKELAASIVYDQEKEIAKMSEWRDKWFAEKTKAINMKFPGMSHGMGGMDLKKLESLKGSDFDIEFIKQMIPHHEGAVEMAKNLQKQDAHAELKELAGDIIREQEAEIKQVREWLGRWQSR
jgi:uncharacterized protein (DUF305 family)